MEDGRNCFFVHNKVLRSALLILGNSGLRWLTGLYNPCLHFTGEHSEV